MGHVSETIRRSLPVATAGAVVVEEVSRRWQWRTDEAGDVVLALIIVELVWYSILILQWVVKKIRGKETRVAVERYGWRSEARERVIKTRKPRHRRRDLVGGAA